MSYGQTGFLTALSFLICIHGFTPLISQVVGRSVFDIRHMKQKFLACADANDRSFYLKSSRTSDFLEMEVIHQVLFDSKGLFDTLKILHDGKDYKLRKNVHRVRD